MEQTVVIKIGSTVMAGMTGNIDAKCVSGLVEQCLKLGRRGFGLLLVVSGAVKLGNGVFVEKPAAAAVGQVRLLQAFDNVGQILLRKSDLRNKKIRHNLLLTIGEFWRRGLMVLVNENDVVELNSFGGNDYLALELARLIDAGTIILLSDVNGLWDQNKKIVVRVDEINREVWKWVDDKNSEGIGGMTAKIRVAQACMKENRKMIIVDGKQKNVLIDLLLKKRLIGTLFEKEI